MYTGVDKILGLALSLSLLGCQGGVDLKTVGGVNTGKTPVVKYKPGAKVLVEANDEEGSEIPLALLNPEQVCKGITFYNQDGDLVEGSQVCDNSSLTTDDPNLTPENIKAGISIAGVEGTLVIPENCAADGATDCVAVAAFPAADKAAFSGSDIRSGISVAGVPGSAVSRPGDCASDGATDCVAVSAYPAVDKGILQANTAKIRSSMAIAGVTGNLGDCASDGAAGCVVLGPTYAAAITAGAAAKIAAGQILAGVTGTAGVRPPDCASDGETSCVAVSNFPAIEKADLTANASRIHDSLTFAGVAGTLANCATDGGTDCFAVANFPAVDKVNVLQANAGKIRSSLSIASVSGSLADCAADAALGCVSVANFPAMALAGAAAKIALGQSLGGVSGSAAIRPSDCAADGGIGCVAVSGFPAMDAAAAPAKIILGQSIAGVAGTGPVRPADCSSDGETSCVAIATYPAVEKADLTANAAKIRDSVTLAGVSGTLEDCSSDGDVGCVAVGPTYAAALLTGAETKILNGQTLAGVNGTAPVRPSDCSTDGGTDCVAIATFPAANAATAPAKIVSGQSVGGIAGTANGVRPPDCASDAELSCVSVTAFPAMQVAGAAAKIAAGDTLAGVAGTAGVRPSDCAADGATNCVAIANFPAVDKVNNITANAAKIRSSVSIAGVSGSLADCSSDGGTICVAVAAFPAAQVAGSAAKILNGQSVAGINGSAAVKPADCSTDGGTDCVAVANYPAIDKSNLQANAAKIRSSLSLVSVSGTLADCAADGASGCVAVAAYPAALAAGAAAKIADGQTLAGVTGTAPLRPNDCSSDGGTDCVAIANFPAVDKATNLSAAKLAKIHSTVTVAGVAGTMASCNSDGGTDCMAVSAYPAANTTGAAAKILTGQTLAGVSGSADAREADCASDGETDCTAVANFPAVDKATNLSAGNRAKIHSTVTVAGVAGTMASCNSDGGTDCMAVSAYPAANTTGAAAKILAGQTLAGVSGSADAREADCASDGETDCTAVANFPAVDKATNLSAGNRAKIHSTVTVAGVAGTMASCNSDGGSDCMAVSAYPAANTTGAAAKILAGQTLAGVSGSADAREADCASDGETDCTAVANFPAVDKATKLSVANAAKIRSSLTIAGVAGTLADCSADGGTDCVAVTNFPAVDKVNNITANAGAIRSSVTIAGVAGTLATCNSDNGTDCVTSTNYPSVVKANVTAGVVKNGTVIAGTTGSYPSSSTPLSGADSTVDLDSATFNAKVKSSTAFEWFDSEGNRYTGSGDTDLVVTNVKAGVDIFGSTGTYGTVCSSDGLTDCITNASYKSANVSAITTWDLRSGKTIAGISGSLNFNSNGADLSRYNRTSGSGANSSTTVADVYDLIDDYNNNSGNLPTLAAPDKALQSSSWLRSSASDNGAGGGTSANGVCDGTEDCVYQDRMTNLYWAKMDGVSYTWEDAITHCDTLSYGTFSDWRLPSVKELMQANVNLIYQLKPTLISASYLWTGTTVSHNTVNAWGISLNNGNMYSSAKSSSNPVVCVRN